MKGTIARGTDRASDEALRAKLANSTKDRAENLMIVDLLRNDVGRIAEPGSVTVQDLFAIETYPTLHTMVSTVAARLRAGMDIASIVRALFPCGSVTGAPKIRAMEIIEELEASPRGAYCGAIGYFAPDGSAQFNVAIRTLTICGGMGSLGVGGAVVHDSGSAAEYEECLLKARYYDSSRIPLALIETMRWTPEKGYARLGLHLDRMDSSAAYFGINFNRDAAEDCLAAATSAASAALRVRLVLKESGGFECTTAPLGASRPAWTYAIAPLRVRSTDVLARHKTNWRQHLDDELSRLSAECGCDEAIFLNERGEVVEGSRSNIFLRRDGALLTPPLSAGPLAGCLRRELLDRGKCREATLVAEDLKTGEVLLGNSLRGLISALAIETACEAG
jgi:para-aminobenzoate synthetase/4-amino-4-deoxychorismate lyase